MKHFLFLILVTLCVFNKVQAASNQYDIYGVDAHTQKKIMACCDKNIKEYMTLHKQFNPTKPDKALFDKIAALEQSIIKDIKKLGAFNVAKFSSIYYPADNEDFLTIDLVKKSDVIRMPASPKRKINNTLSKKSPELNQVFKLWEKYEENNQKQMYSGKPFKQKTCPVAHCIYGFDKKEITTYLPGLKKGAQQYKPELMDIIAHSGVEQDRIEAIYILAHRGDSEEVAQYLIQYTDDSSDSVRNASMRVVSAILEKHDVPNLDLSRVFIALNYPNVTDRNKAAYMLYNIVSKNNSYHRLSIQQAGNTLIDLLKLKQPNNHGIAYRILKIISQKDYAETDVASWEKWLASASKTA